MDPARIDTVGVMLSALRAYQKETHKVDHKTLMDKERMELMRGYALGLVVEQVELLQELPWKPWAYTSSDMSDVDTKKAVKEWTDCLVFLLDQALCLKISAEDIVSTFYNILETKRKTQITK